MEGKGQKIIALALALLVCTGVSAQKKSEQKDSLVRLIKAKSLELMEKDGTNYRKTIDATFFHNNTYNSVSSRFLFRFVNFGYVYTFHFTRHCS